MSTRARFSMACVGALALFAAAYSNSLRNSFHFDDAHVVEQNMYVRDVANIPRFFTDARTFSSLPQNAVYRPLLSMSLAIDYRIAGGLDPVVYHLSQLTLLAALGAMLVVFYRRVLDTAADAPRAVWIALFAATLFCVHTANTQPANYISARSEILSALGIVGGFLLYAGAPASRRWHLYLLPVVLGALAKNPAVMFAPLLLAYKLFIEQQLSAPQIFSREAWPRTRAAIRSSVPAFLVAVALFVFIERMNPPGQSYGGGTRSSYLATQAWMWVRYLALYFVPAGLTADTDIHLFAGFDVRTLLGVLVLGGTLALAWWASRARDTRPITFGLLWFWISLVPTSSIFPLAEVTNDHRMFLPFVGLNLAVVLLVARAIQRVLARSRAPATRRLAVVSLAVTVLVIHATATFERNRVWRSEESLWGDVAVKSPRNGRGLMNYGLSQMRRGRYLEARDIFLRALQYSPDYSYLEVNLGIVNGALQNQVEAERHFRRAASLEPSQPAVHRYFARWLIQRGRGPEAMTELQALMRLSPADGDSRHELMALCAARGDHGCVDALTREALAIAGTDSVALAYASHRPPFSPSAGDDSAAWYRLGLSYTRSGRHVAAAQAYRVAVARDPGNADAWNNLGWTLGTLGFYEDAVVPLERAVALRPAYQLARNNLAWVRDQARRGPGT